MELSERDVNRIARRVAELLRAMQPREVMNSEQVAAYLGVSTDRVRRLCSEGELPHYRDGGGRRMYFRLSEVEAWQCRERVKTNREVMREDENRRILARVR